MEYEGAIVFVLGALLVYMIYDKYYTGNRETVESKVDHHEYLVQSKPDKQIAADLLAKIRQNLDALKHHLEKMYPDDPRTKRIVQRFDSERISEGGDESKDYTSYSVNKGEKIVFCLRARDGSDDFEDINMLMFVAIHELAHIATDEEGHTDTFWENMKFLLEEGINIGIYIQQDFSQSPQEYCGMQVTSSPLDEAKPIKTRPPVTTTNKPPVKSA
jgi:hypothetical protein